MIKNALIKKDNINILQGSNIVQHRQNNVCLTCADSVSLYGKRTIVTGAASGIGKAITIRFAEAGSEMVLIDKDEKGLSELAGILDSNGFKNSYFNIDLSSKDDIERFWISITGFCPDILVNNAGIYPFMDYLKVDRAFYEKTMDINLNSVFWMCQNFIRLRGNAGGTIVNTSSIEAVTPFKEDLAHYSVSKSGVIALTKSLARDYGRKGFRVNAVLPGAIKTPGTESLVRKALRGLQLKLIKTAVDFNSRLTLGRWGNPDEVAKVVLFLSCDLSSYVQGATIPVDGGFLSS